MPFKKGVSGNAKGLEPGSRAPTNKQIKNALKKCSLEAIENIAQYMKDCRDYIDSQWAKYHSLVEEAEQEPDAKLREEKLEKADSTRVDIFKYYGKLTDASQTLLDYTHKHIVNDERVNRTTKTTPEEEENEKEPAARVSLKAVQQ